MQAETLTAIDPEILNFIESRKPIWQQSGNLESVQVVLDNLKGLDQDELLSLYLNDQIDSWVTERLLRECDVKKSHITPAEPEITLETIKRYINRRYDRWLDYSTFHCQLNKLNDQAGDLLNEVLIMVLLKDENKLFELYSQKKDGYTGLDFYVLNLIKMNSHSKTSPYRFKYKTLLRDSNASAVLMDEDHDTSGDAQSLQHQNQYDEFLIDEEDHDPMVEDYEDTDRADLVCMRFQIIRDILNEAVILTEKEKRVFAWKFFLDSSWKDWTGKEKTRQLQVTYKTVQNYIISQVAKRKEEYNLKVIHDLFSEAKQLSISLTESQFLVLREWTSREREHNSDQITITPETGDAEEKAKLDELWKKQTIITGIEKKLLLSMEQGLTNFNIHFKF